MISIVNYIELSWYVDAILTLVIKYHPNRPDEFELSSSKYKRVQVTVSDRAAFIITRDSEVIMFSPCVFVCVCLSMFVTMFVRTI